jgi:SAM-dependent methyltransferase
MLARLDPRPQQLVVDAGCGTGATLELLQKRGVRRAIGFDLHPELIQTARKKGVSVLRADLVAQPLATGTVDMVLSECAWNLTDKRQTLAECARILKPGGLLAISDIYLRSLPGAGEQNCWPEQSCFFQATDIQAVRDLVIEAGFNIVTLEDHSRLLTQAAAEFVFAHGSLQGFWQSIFGDEKSAKKVCSLSASVRPGLFLLIACWEKI